MKLKMALDNFEQSSFDTGLHCKDPSLAKQSFAEDADINTIVNRFGLTGQLPTNVNIPLQGDFKGIFDYMTAMNTIIAANRAFMTMPAKVRTRFNNDPGVFLDFCHDPENYDEATKLGLVNIPVQSASATAQATQGAQTPPAPAPKPQT